MKLDRVMVLLETLEGPWKSDDLRSTVNVHHAEDGYSLLFKMANEGFLGAPVNYFPWIEYNVTPKLFTTIDAAVDDALRAVDAALKNKVVVLEQQAADTRKAIG